MRKPSSKISDTTRSAVLEAAWDLMSGHGRIDAGMSDIAAAAGVSRQTLFLAFGSRAGLLLAMVRHKDTQGDFVQRMRDIAKGTGASAATLHAFVDAWIDYLPHVYPVAIQLETAALLDPEVAVAWQDRIFGQGVRLGLDLILARMSAAGLLSRGTNAAHIADECLALIVPSAWRHLVVERGWTAEAFAASRHALLDSVLHCTLDAALAVKPPAKPKAQPKPGEGKRAR